MQDIADKREMGTRSKHLRPRATQWTRTLATSLFITAFITVFCAAFSSSVWAEECGPAFRLDERGGSMEHVPVLDQGKLGSCYAYSASAILDAWRISHGDLPDGRFIQPEILAVDARLDHTPGSSDIDGGNLSRALETGLRGGCLKWKGDSQALQLWLTTAGRLGAHASYLHGRVESDQEELKNLDDPKYCETLVRDGKHPSAEKVTCLARVRFQRQALSDTHSKLIQGCRDIATQGGATPNALERLTTDPQKILAHGQFPPLLPAQKSLKSVLCDPKNRLVIKEPKPKVKTTSLLDKDHKMPANDGSFMKNLFNRHFEKPAQPLGIDFCSNLLHHGEGGRKYASNRVLSEGCGPHSALVIGRRKTFFGRCQYLIRNSWGKECDRYNHDWDCERGSVWVDETTLAPNTFKTHHLAN